MSCIELLILLIGAHFICDYVLQGDAVATGKNRRIDPCRFGVSWWYWMTAHAVTHGFGVGLITRSVWLGACEAAAHWLIDFGECEKAYCLHEDQILHIICKLAILLCVVL